MILLYSFFRLFGSVRFVRSFSFFFFLYFLPAPLLFSLYVSFLNIFIHHEWLQKIKNTKKNADSEWTNSVHKARYILARKLNSTLLNVDIHTANKVERIGNKVDRDKLSNSRCCRFVAGFGNSRLSTKLTALNSTLSPVCTGLKTTKG